MQLVVEESGCCEFLKDRLAQDGPFEVVHISCHGDILKSGGPVVALETPEGGLALTAPGELAGRARRDKAATPFLIRVPHGRGRGCRSPLLFERLSTQVSPMSLDGTVRSTTATPSISPARCTANWQSTRPFPTRLRRPAATF